MLWLEKIRLLFRLAELSRKLKNFADYKKFADYKIFAIKKLSWLQTISPELLNLSTEMTADVSDVGLLVVVCFFAVTKPASICNHKKFRNHENDSLQITR